MISFIRVIDVLKTFSVNHWQLQKFDFDFREQMPNFATIDEAFPILYVVPVGTVNLQFGKEFELDIFCVDRYKKDRSNVGYVISDTELILSDLSVYLENQTVFDSSYGNTTPVNNDLLDYVGGHVMRIRVTVEKQALCEIPFDGEQPTPPTCPSALVRNSDGSWSEIVASGATYILPDTPVTVRNVSGDEVGSGEVPSVTGGVVTVPDCPLSGDGTAVLKDTDGNVLSTTQVAPETTVDITAPDATYLVEYEDGTPIESGSIVSGGSKVIDVPNPIVCADTTLQINGVTEGSFASGSTIDVQLTDGVNPVIPTSVAVVGNVVTATLPVGGTDQPWVRNPDWLPLDDVQPGDNKFSGLWAVYEDIPSTHFFSYQISGGAVSEVDYGDGNTQTASNNINYEHHYDYATLAGQILIDPELGNYKMVVINAQLTNVTSSLFFDRHGTQGYTSNPLGWLDIIVNCQSMTTFNISTQRTSQYLERLRIVENAINNHNSIFQFLSRIRILDLGLSETSNTSNFISLFTYTNSNFTSSNNEPFSIINNVATNMASTFNQAMGIKKIGTISSTSATSIAAIFTNGSSLEEIDKVLTPNVLNTTNVFNECRNLKIINEIDVSFSTTANGMFSGCQNLTKIGVNNYLYMPDCTVGVNMFNSASSLKNITLHMPNLENMGTMFLKAASIEEITFEVPIINITNLASAFQQCYKLRKIDLSGSTISGSIANAFNLSFNLQEVILGDCTNVNNTNGVFAGTQSLKKVRIPNIRLSFSLVNTAIEAPDMVVVFNDLADLITLGLPTQTIVITGTPAAVNLTLAERAIATDKDWTITG